MWQKIKMFFEFVADVFRNRRVLISLAKNDIKVRYLGSHLGMLWAFIQPLCTVCLMWFVFSIGFKVTPVENFPYILWLVTGMIPWFFIAEAIPSAAYSVVENSYLVKKIVFRISLLPLIKLISALFIHGFFIFFIFFIFAVYGYYPNIYALQLVYYLFAATCLLAGLSLVTSAVVVFVRDFGQIINVCIQFLFWGTPIFWSISAVPTQYRWLFQFNPIYYIVNGYRDAMINFIWFWQHPFWTLYFWIFTALTFIVGALLFRKLKPHFADVL